MVCTPCARIIVDRHLGLVGAIAMPPRLQYEIISVHSRFTSLVKVPSKDTAAVLAVLSRYGRKLPPRSGRSLARNHRLEMASVANLARLLSDRFIIKSIHHRTRLQIGDGVACS